MRTLKLTKLTIQQPNYTVGEVIELARSEGVTRSSHLWQSFASTFSAAHGIAN